LVGALTWAFAGETTPAAPTNTRATSTMTEEAVAWTMTRALERDTILAALRSRGLMTRDDIRNLFARNKSSAEIETALRFLLEKGKIRKSSRAPEGGKGRPAEVWEAV
jgi:predicted transcriptional regulator